MGKNISIYILALPKYSYILLSVFKVWISGFSDCSSQNCFKFSSSVLRTITSPSNLPEGCQGQFSNLNPVIIIYTCRSIIYGLTGSVSESNSYVLFCIVPAYNLVVDEYCGGHKYQSDRICFQIKVLRAVLLYAIACKVLSSIQLCS